MAVSEAKKRANNKWVANNLKRFSIAIPKSEAEEIEKFCSDNNMSKNLFFRMAAKEKIERKK